MKLFSTSFSFILLFSAIVPSTALSNGYKNKNKSHSQQSSEWELEDDALQIQQRNKQKYEKHAQKNRKNRGKYQKKSSEWICVAQKFDKL